MIQEQTETRKVYVCDSCKEEFVLITLHIGTCSYKEDDGNRILCRFCGFNCKHCGKRQHISKMKQLGITVTDNDDKEVGVRHIDVCEDCYNAAQPKESS